jgi:diamine N-acetyltransferase
MCRISLHEITAANWRATLSLTVHPEQQRFIADYTPIASLILAKAYVRPGGLLWTPYPICDEQTLIGLLALAYQPDSIDQY